MMCIVQFFSNFTLK